MLKFIKNLRLLPDETKKPFSVIVSVVFTIIIVTFYFSVSDPIIATGKKGEVKTTTEEKLPSPFMAIASEVSTSFGDIKNELSVLPIKSLLSAWIKGEATSTNTEEASTTETENAKFEKEKASNTILAVATTTKEVKTTPNSDKVAVAVIKKVEPPPVAYGPYLIPGVDIAKTDSGERGVLIVRSVPTPPAKPKKAEPVLPDTTDVVSITPTVKAVEPTLPNPDSPPLDTSILSRTTQSLWPKTYTSGSGQ